MSVYETDHESVDRESTVLSVGGTRRISCSGPRMARTAARVRDAE